MIGDRDLVAIGDDWNVSFRARAAFLADRGCSMRTEVSTIWIASPKPSQFFSDYIRSENEKDDCQNDDVSMGLFWNLLLSEPWRYLELGKGTLGKVGLAGIDSPVNLYFDPAISTFDQSRGGTASETCKSFPFGSCSQGI